MANNIIDRYTISFAILQNFSSNSSSQIFIVAFEYPIPNTEIIVITNPDNIDKILIKK